MAATYEDLQERLRAVARPEETPDTLLEMAVNHFIAERQRENAREHEEARWEAAKVRAQAELNGSCHPFDPKAAYQHHRERYGWTEDLSNLTPEELMNRADATLAAMPPEKIAELERLGFL